MSIVVRCDQCLKLRQGSAGVENSAATGEWHEPKPYLHFCSDFCLFEWAKVRAEAQMRREAV